MDRVIPDGFAALQISQENKDGKKSPIVQNVFFNEEEQSAKYACPSLFRFLTKYFMKENK